eukprot:10254420-Alexandrium_andersonii.AAC.1
MATAAAEGRSTKMAQAESAKQRCTTANAQQRLKQSASGLHLFATASCTACPGGYRPPRNPPK